jgi:hypothetical protein
VQIRSMLRAVRGTLLGGRFAYDRIERRVATSGALAVGIITLVLQLALGTTVADLLLGSWVAWLHPVAWIVGALCVAVLAVGVWWLILGSSIVADRIERRRWLRQHAVDVSEM